MRIADTPHPAGGWEPVPVAGRAPIVNNDFRRNTAVIDAALPRNPADTDLYYTVWKDGRNVTADPRPGTDSVGSGTGQVGGVPGSGAYVGRLPRLSAPYRLCGLSCHAINGSQPNLPDAGPGGGFFVHDQPTPGAYRHLEDYGFQVMMWEDDVWYMELLLYPPSPDDAYKIVTTTLCGPTTRWQMMRHWNTINPGDHDYGMDDVKGPEQIAIRAHADLGQDRDYMRRNFQIVHHLVTGDEAPSGTENPKKWRRWKMPGGDFSLLILDSRLWRSSQDTNIWDDQGWGAKQNLYPRADVTRSLLGEEQFAWLRETIRTDSSPLICLTGINGLHTIWTGDGRRPDARTSLGERDRVSADYAGWVAAGADRVLELLGSRTGVTTVYGDVHTGMILQNLEHRVFECSFGPIGRSGGRGVKEGFGPRMTDFDGREVAVTALYHQSYDTPDLRKLDGPFYWNFLEMEFDPRGEDPAIGLRVRNLVDPPSERPRGGGQVRESASRTGRIPSCSLPATRLPAGADVLLSRTDGRPLRGARTLPDGAIARRGPRRRGTWGNRHRDGACRRESRRHTDRDRPAIAVSVQFPMSGRTPRSGDPCGKPPRADQRAAPEGTHKGSPYQGIFRLVCLRPFSAASCPPDPIMTPSSIMAITESGRTPLRKATPADLHAAKTRCRAACSRLESSSPGSFVACNENLMSLGPHSANPTPGT